MYCLLCLKSLERVMEQYITFEPVVFCPLGYADCLRLSEIENIRKSPLVSSDSY